MVVLDSEILCTAVRHVTATTLQTVLSFIAFSVPVVNLLYRTMKTSMITMCTIFVALTSTDV